MRGEGDKILALEAKLKKSEKANHALSKKKLGKTLTKRKTTAKLDITRKLGNINKPIIFKGKSSGGAHQKQVANVMGLQGDTSLANARVSPF